MLRDLVTRLVNVTPIFDSVRWLVEAGYAGERRVICTSGLLSCTRVLDLGCGTGIFAPLFFPEQYVGVDVNPHYIERAQKRCPRHLFLLSDGTRVPLEDASCDACMISGVLHHLTDHDALELLREAARVVRPGGLLVVWEDTKEVSWYNIPGRFLHALDAGAYIRTASTYEALVSQVFTINRASHMRSGFMEYHVMHCSRPL